MNKFSPPFWYGDFWCCFLGESRKIFVHPHMGAKLRLKSQASQAQAQITYPDLKKN